MFKVKYVKQKIFITLGYTAFFTVFWLLQLPCIYLHFFGVPCPGCGMSHALMAALRFDIIESLRCHPMLFSMPILYLYFWTDGGLFKNKIIDRIVLYSIATGFLINWIFKIFS